MWKRTSRLLGSLTLVILLGVAGRPVLAQAPSTGFGLGAVKVPTALKKAERSKGLRFGRSVFHAGLGLEAGWDSNVYYYGDNPVSSAYLRLVPELSLGTDSSLKKPPSVVYNLNLGMDYVGYLQKIPGTTMSRHQIGAKAGGSLLFNPQGAFRFGLVEQFVRTSEPRAGLDQGGLYRDFNSAGFDMTINPGHGLLSILLAYRLEVDIFEQSSLKWANVLRNKASVKVDWRFFPLTTAWLKVDAGYSYFYGSDLGSAGTAQGFNRDYVPLLVMLGATGRLTPKLTLDLGIGYRGLFFTGQTPSIAGKYETSAHTAAANAALKWQIGPTAGLALGYQYDRKESVMADYMDAHSAYLALDLAFVQRLQIAAKVAYTYGTFVNFLDSSGGTLQARTRSDHYLIGALNVQYYFLTWLSAGVGYEILGDITGYSLASAGNAGFVKHRVYGLVSVYY